MALPGKGLMQKVLTMAITRFEMRLDKEIKTKAEKAAALLGMKSLTEYAVKLIDEDASRVIAQHEGITIKDDLFDRFVYACEKAKHPNIALREAALFTRKQRIE
jgi:uncharacterized protein (DUF1778 family)